MRAIIFSTLVLVAISGCAHSKIIAQDCVALGGSQKLFECEKVIKD